jgi:hypothetical protein
MAKKKTGRPPTHGERSVSVRQRFDDGRTEQGKALKETLGALVAHYGGLSWKNYINQRKLI